MQSNRRKFLLVVIILLAILWLKDYLKSDESRVQEFLDEVTRYALAKDAGGLKDYLDTEYKDAKGTDYETAVTAIRYFCFHFRPTELKLITLAPPTINEDVAEVNIRIELKLKTQRKDTALSQLGFRHDTFRIKLKRYGSYYRIFYMENIRPPLDSTSDSPSERGAPIE